MATLEEIDRKSVWQISMAKMPPAEIMGGFTKLDLRAAVAAIDGWIDANSATIDAILPAPVRIGLTPVERIRLFGRVAAKRADKRVEPS